VTGSQIVKSFISSRIFAERPYYNRNKAEPSGNTCNLLSPVRSQVNVREHANPLHLHCYMKRGEAACSNIIFFNEMITVVCKVAKLLLLMQQLFDIIREMRIILIEIDYPPTVLYARKRHLALVKRSDTPRRRRGDVKPFF
jgi:hypothetical protein